MATAFFILRAHLLAKIPPHLRGVFLRANQNSFFSLLCPPYICVDVFFQSRHLNEGGARGVQHDINLRVKIDTAFKNSCQSRFCNEIIDILILDIYIYRGPM